MFRRTVTCWNSFVTVFLLSSLGFWRSAAGQTTVSGRVLDLVNNRGVRGALVKAVGTSVQTRTDSLGRFTLKLPPGRYQLQAKMASTGLTNPAPVQIVVGGKPVSGVEIPMLPKPAKLRLVQEIGALTLPYTATPQKLARDPDLVRYVALEVKAEELAKKARNTVDAQQQAVLEGRLRKIVSDMFDARLRFRQRLIEQAEKRLEEAKKLLNESVQQRELLIEHKISKLLYGQGPLDW